MGFESFFARLERIFLALKYPPWITVENNSTIEKENNGSNGGVKKNRRRKGQEERERVAEKMVREKSGYAYERREEKLRDSRVGDGGNKDRKFNK